mmetsp:Transcript_24689/g.52380  ORF Transcript_24689/g.52380 Transcript_24689/m.52380 type:complete len:215 (+) Transcript_24689:271-915(+)
MSISMSMKNAANVPLRYQVLVPVEDFELVKRHIARVVHVDEVEKVTGRAEVTDYLQRLVPQGSGYPAIALIVEGNKSRVQVRPVGALQKLDKLGDGLAKLFPVLAQYAPLVNRDLAITAGVKEAVHLLATLPLVGTIELRAPDSGDALKKILAGEDGLWIAAADQSPEAVIDVLIGREEKEEQIDDVTRRLHKVAPPLHLVFSHGRLPTAPALQ